MTDLDDLLTSELVRPSGRPAPPLDALRRRAARRRRTAVAAGVALACVLGLIGIGAASYGPLLRDGLRTQVADGDPAPRQPSRAGYGVLAGRVVEVPEPTQRPVTLRFTGPAGSYDVRTAQGAAWELELPAGSYRITAVEGGGVCSPTVTVHPDAWSRHDVGWPCEAPPDGGPPATPLAARFDNAPEWPGEPWRKDGHEVPTQDISLAAGPEHCDWQEAVFLGAAVLPAPRETGRLWSRDPKGVLTHHPRAQQEFQARATLPPDAEPTGYTQGPVELWVAPSDEWEYVYLVNADDPDDVERWVQGGGGCA